MDIENLSKRFKEDGYIYIKNFFDENFFLYLENNDLCLRVRKANKKIYIIKNSLM